MVQTDIITFKFLLINIVVLFLSFLLVMQILWLIPIQYLSTAFRPFLSLVVNNIKKNE